ncbi:hypothetical protein NCU09193 [Paecilomyces variotii No. 5]|uniref:Ribosomal protein s17 n=1 Tax=Byssochlamys spectabilis (strain No. 5 / NBRC 109023) TaxID=1356009 RepID=V5HUX9_BYSSN|nr:hypothetical protein NCU09193 [Paecilomyces variotii No. 5]
MVPSVLLICLLGSAGLIEGAAMNPYSYNYGSPLEKRADSTCLSKRAIQTASSFTGQESGAEAGQADSATDDANFINFCSGQTLTNGQQKKGGSCNGIVMGKIPSADNMISAMITNPQPGDKVAAGDTFTISVQTNNLKAGSFTNAQSTYYSAPQDLDSNGNIIGHCHVTVQEIGSLTSTTPPDPSKFAFFKGINDDGNGKGLLSATVTGGLPAGVYRVCTMISSSNHQPVLMPVAQRGAQDDCTKFEVVSNGSGNTNSNNSNSNSNSNSNGSSSNSNAKVTVQSGSLGGAPPTIQDSGNPSRPFSVNGNTFVNSAAAVQRACDIQFNQCADAANAGKLGGKTVNDCQNQKNSCRAA